jgi:murein tripeptide amidase MpaA
MYVSTKFNKHGLATLDYMKLRARQPSRQATILVSLEIVKALQDQALQGFTHIVMRKPNTNEERTIVFQI